MSDVSPDASEDHAVALDALDDPALRRDDFLIPPAVGGDFPLTAADIEHLKRLQTP